MDKICWRSSRHHLYCDVGICRSGAGREGASRPRHRLKKHAEDGWLRKWQVVQCGCSLSANTSLPLGSASPKFHTLTAHQALRTGFFSYLKPNTFWPKPFSSYTWNVGHPAFCQAQNLCPNTLYITNLHQMVPKWSWIHSLLSVPTPTACSCSFTRTTAEPQRRLPKRPLFPQPAQSSHQCEAFPTPSSLSPLFPALTVLCSSLPVQNQHIVWTLFKTCLSQHNSSRAGTMFYNFPSILRTLYLSTAFHNKEILSSVSLFQLPLCQVFLLMLFSNFLFWNHYRFMGSWKNSRADPCTLHPVSPNGNILHNFRIVSKPGNGHWHNLQTLFRFCRFYMHMCVCICIRDIYANVTRRDLCNHHHRTVPRHTDPSHWPL